ncbi:hypothetical protein [Phenylobacterium sp.]|jgi:hypothetical protein|uniref:hypothetical protein n=1 Tax=Phenylobacterium sp. TaxID=1871053 RepID=UPI002F951B6A
MRTPIVVLAVALGLSGCTLAYNELEQVTYDLCQRQSAHHECRNNGYVHAGARILEDPTFGQPARAPSDLGEPAPL